MSVLTNQSVCALQAATTAACVEAMNSSSPQDLWSHILGIVYPIIQEHARQQTLRATSISRLPNELLVEVFAHLSLWDRVRTAMVCHKWRAVSLDAISELWSDIPHLEEVDTYWALLARARDHPVALEYAPDDLSSIHRFYRVLDCSLHRVRSLVLCLPVPRNDDELIMTAEYLLEALEGPSPILESLCISDHRGILRELELPMLGTHALRTVILHSFNPSCLEPCAGSSILRTLKISTPIKYDTLLQKDWILISSFPALDRLALHLASVNNMSVLSLCPPLPPLLQHLYLEMPGECLDHFAAVDDLSRFRTLHISFHRRAPRLRRLATLMPFLPARTASASARIVLGGFALMAADGHGRSWVLTGLAFDPDWASLVPNVTRLWIDSWQFYDEGSASRLLAVEELVLDATTSMSRSDEPSWPGLELPRLRAARVLSYDAGPAVPAGPVLDYLRRLPRLATLILDGMALEPEPGVDLPAALRAVAEHVSSLRSDTVAPESPRVWSESWGKITEF